MAKSKNQQRQRPSTPTIHLSPLVEHFLQHTADPSPPETPMTASSTSPPLSRKSSLKPRHQPPFFDESLDSLEQDPAIRPVGNDHKFSYQPRLPPDQPSPKSSPSSSSSDNHDGSSEADSSDHPNIATLWEPAEQSSTMSSDDDDDDDADEEEADTSNGASTEDELHEETSMDGSRWGQGSAGSLESVVDPPHGSRQNLKAGVIFNFIIEDVDVMDDANEGLEVLFPSEIESLCSQPQTGRSRERLDPSLTDELRNLRCSAATESSAAVAAGGDDGDSDSNEEDPIVPSVLDFDEVAFMKRRGELRRFRRVSMSSSFGKRTHSEMSDSDPDETGSVDVSEVGSSARRMRKRLHRSSLLFQDPPAPRIDELDEPDSSDDDGGGGGARGRYVDVQSFAMELPYWTLEIMEVPDV